MMRALRFFLIPGLIFLTSCSPRAGNLQHRFGTETIDGIRTAVTSGGPRFSDPLFEYREVLRLKEDPSNEESLLYNPGIFIQDDDGSFYVSDYGNHRIAVFDPSGEYVRAFGREGNGPGEFTTINELTIQGDLVHVYDVNNGRVNRFHRDGSLLDVISIPYNSGAGRYGIVWQMFVTEDEELVIINQHDERDGDAESYMMKVVVMSAEHEEMWQTETPMLRTGIWTTYAGDRLLNYSIPYPPRPMILFDTGQGIVVSPGDEPVLRLYDINGTLRLKIQVNLEPRMVTSEDRSKVMDRFNQRAAEGNDRTKQLVQAQKESVVFPPTKPFWTNITIDGTGFFWLQVTENTVDRQAAGGGYLYRILSPEGEYLGDTRIPSTGRFTVNNGQMMINIYDREAETPQLIVYQIEPVAAGLKYPD